MATSAGSLAVFLGLDVGEFTRGLSKAERDAQQFARNTRTAILEVGKVFGGLAIGNEFIKATKAILEEANALNDLADSTGASVEALSALRNQAYIAGTDLATLQGALNKLAAGMAGTDEETSKAKDALRALGITTRDPARAFQEAARELATYEDGVNKVGIAIALFGKQGAALLPTLKDVAELQEVGATYTKQQADEAERLGKEYRRLAVEATAFKDVLLSGVVPALADTIQAFRVAQGQGVGFFQSLDFAMRGQGELAENIATIERNITSLQGRLDAYKATTASSKPAFASTVEAMTAEIDKAKRALNALNAIRGPKESDFGPPVLRGEAPAGFGKDAKVSRSAKAQISEADQYLKSLRQSVVAAQELTATETVLQEVQNGRLQNASRGQIDQALQYAQEIDAIKAATKAREEQKRTDEEAARIRERISQASAREIEGAQKEAESLRDANEQMREQLVFLRGGQEALDAYTIAKLSKAAAERDDQAAVLANAGAAETLIEAIKAQAAALRERAALVGEAGFIEGLKREAQAIQDVRNMFADTFADAFADFISGAKSAKEAFADFANDILRQVSRIAAQNVANQIFGGNNSAGPDVFGVFSKLLGAYFGGGGGGVPGVGFSGGGFGEHFAAGGISRGGPAMVGENGPEMVTLPRGAMVMPNHELRNRGFGRDVTVVNNFAFSGPVSAATQQQVAAAAGASVRRASKR
jgi:hypothetical protein